MSNIQNYKKCSIFFFSFLRPSTGSQNAVPRYMEICFVKKHILSTSYCILIFIEGVRPCQSYISTYLQNRGQWGMVTWPIHTQTHMYVYKIKIKYISKTTRIYIYIPCNFSVKMYIYCPLVSVSSLMCSMMSCELMSLSDNVLDAC